MDINILISLFGVFLTCVGYYAYFRDIFLGKTTPHFFSWLLWGGMTVIIFFIQLAEGGGIGTWVTATTAFFSLVIALLALKNPNKNISRSDWVSFILGLLSIPLWLISDTPLYSLLLLVIIDAFGFYPTIRKSWSHPEEETAIHYLLAGIKFIPAIITLEILSFNTAFYPAFLVVLNIGFWGMLLWRKKVLGLGRKNIM